jgi:hypothetical protein
MTEFWWASIGLAAVVVLAWLMNWSRWDPKIERRNGGARLHLRPHHHVG